MKNYLKHVTSSGVNLMRKILILKLEKYLLSFFCIFFVHLLIKRCVLYHSLVHFLVFSFINLPLNLWDLHMFTLVA
jgi:hypothetical protein